MATIRKREWTTKTGRKKTSWQVLVRKQGRNVAQSFQRRLDAERYARKIENEIDENRYRTQAEAQKHTLGEAIERYMRTDFLRKRASTRKIESYNLNWWIEHHGDRTLDKVTRPWLVKVRDSMKCGPHTRGKYLSQIRIILDRARLDWFWMTENPFEGWKIAAPSRRVVRYLEPEERERLLKACRESVQPLLYPMVVFALETGARYGEIANLRRREVDLARRQVTFLKTKNAHARTLPLEGEAYDLVAELLRTPRIDNDRVFPGKGDGPILIKKSWQTALKRAEVEKFRFHDLRHTFASYLAMSGATLAEIAEALGHRTLEMVKRYAHLSEAHTAGVIRRMREKFLS